MHWLKALTAGVLAALLLSAQNSSAQNLTRLPPPSVPKDTSALADSSKHAAGNDTADDTVSYSAVRIRFRGDHFSLSDRALLKYQGSTLIADSIAYYSGDDIVDATGAPLITDAINPPILGYRMRYNLKNKVGTIYYGSSKRGTQSFNGTEIRRQPEGDVYIARGELSTCALPDPHYYFYARRMIVEPESKVLSGPIVMNIAEVPVAILPMMVMPLGKGRRSGLLQPKLGGDQSQGFYLNNLGYYWAINDYSDLLMSGDLIEGSKGTFDNTNLNTTYQWNKRYWWSGVLTNKVYVSEFDPSRAGGYLDFRNDLNLTPDGRQTLKGSGRIQSDPTIVTRNALTQEEALEQTANANLGYRRQFDWNQATLNADVTQTYNLTQNYVDRSLPNVTFHAGGPLIPAPEDETPGVEDPWYRKWNWDYNDLFNVDQVSRPTLNSAKGDTNVYVGYSDHLSLSGKYSAGYINLTPSVNLAQLWSIDERTGDTAKPYRTRWDPSHGKTGEYFAGWSTGLTADTRFYGITQAGDHPWLGRIAAVRHTVSPSVSATYAPKLDSNTHYYANPKIGGTAFQEEQRTMTLGLGNDVDFKLADPGAPKKKPESYKLFHSNSSVSYNFANHTRPWSEINSNLSLYLTRNISFDLNTVHDLYDDFAPTAQKNELISPVLQSWRFGWRKGLEVGGGFSTGLRTHDVFGSTDRFDQSPWSVSLNYGFDFNANRVGTSSGSPTERFLGTSEIYQITKTHQASGSLKINPTAGWKMSYDTQFDFTQGRFSSHVFGFERTLHCWKMDFHWTPVGVAQGWNFIIYVIDLPDVKLQSSDTHGLRRNQ